MDTMENPLRHVPGIPAIFCSSGLLPAAQVLFPIQLALFPGAPDQICPFRIISVTRTTSNASSGFTGYGALSAKVR